MLVFRVRHLASIPKPAPVFATEMYWDKVINLCILSVAMLISIAFDLSNKQYVAAVNRIDGNSFLLWVKLVAESSQ